MKNTSRAAVACKVIVVIAVVVVVALAEFAGRPVAYGVVTAFGLLAASIHIWWLPSHGINGWTGQPRDKYPSPMTRKK